jgi:hypothetical protein
MNSNYFTLLALLLGAGTQMTYTMQNQQQLAAKTTTEHMTLADYDSFIDCLKEEFEERGFPALPNPNAFHSLSAEEHGLLNSHEMELLKRYCDARAKKPQQTRVLDEIRSLPEGSRDTVKKAYMLYTKLDYRFKKMKRATSKPNTAQPTPNIHDPNTWRTGNIEWHIHDYDDTK